MKLSDVTRKVEDGTLGKQVRLNIEFADAVVLINRGAVVEFELEEYGFTHYQRYNNIIWEDEIPTTLANLNADFSFSKTVDVYVSLSNFDVELARTKTKKRLDRLKRTFEKNPDNVPDEIITRLETALRSI